LQRKGVRDASTCTQLLAKQSDHAHNYVLYFSGVMKQNGDFEYTCRDTV
jgi:hypothetical protein